MKAKAWNYFKMEIACFKKLRAASRCKAAIDDSQSHMNHLKKTYLTAIPIIFLSACGGSGGSSTTMPTVSNSADYLTAKDCFSNHTLLPQADGYRFSIQEVYAPSADGVGGTNLGSRHITVENKGQVTVNGTATTKYGFGPQPLDGFSLLLDSHHGDEIYAHWSGSGFLTYGSMSRLTVFHQGTSTTQRTYSTPVTLPFNLAANIPLTQKYTVKQEHRQVECDSFDPTACSGWVAPPSTSSEFPEERTVTYLGLEPVTVSDETIAACKFRIQVNTYLDVNQGSPFSSLDVTEWTIADGPKQGRFLKSVVALKNGYLVYTLVGGQ